MSWKWKVLSRVRLFVTPPGVGSLSLLQGIFPTQGLNPGLPHCRWILYHLSQQGRPQSESCLVVSDSLPPHGLQHARPPCPSPTPGVHSNPCPLSRWCHPTISSSVVLFSSCPQPFPSQGLFKWVSSSHQVAEVLTHQRTPILYIVVCICLSEPPNLPLSPQLPLWHNKLVVRNTFLCKKKWAIFNIKAKLYSESLRVMP